MQEDIPWRLRFSPSSEGPLQGFGEGLVQYPGSPDVENDLGMARRCTEEFWAGHGALVHGKSVQQHGPEPSQAALAGDHFI